VLALKPRAEYSNETESDSILNKVYNSFTFPPATTMSLDRTRERARSLVRESYPDVPEPFTGQGNEMVRSLRVYKQLFDGEAGEVIPENLKPRASRAVRQTHNRDIVPPSSLGASEGIVDAASRPDPAHHSKYKDMVCGQELYDQIVNVAQGAAKLERVHPKVLSSPFFRGISSKQILFAVSDAVRQGTSSHLISKYTKGIMMGGDSVGTLSMRMSLDASGSLSKVVTALPLSEYHVGEVLWQRGLESNRFLFTPDPSLTPQHLLQTRRDGSTVPPTLVVLGSKFRSIIRQGSGSKLMLRLTRDMGREEAATYREQARRLSRVLTAVARGIFPAPPGKRFGAKRMAQIYNTFVKSPMNEFRGSINAARYQRTMPLLPELRTLAQQNPEFKKDLQDMRAGFSRSVKVVKDPSHPRGYRIKFSGLRKLMDDKLEVDPEKRQVKVFTFDGKTFGNTVHKAREVRGSLTCSADLTGPGVSTNIDPDAPRLLALVRKKDASSSTYVCKKPVAGRKGQGQVRAEGEAEAGLGLGGEQGEQDEESEQGEQSEESEQDEQGEQSEESEQGEQGEQGEEQIRQSEEAERALFDPSSWNGCVRSARTVDDQSHLLQRIILSRRSWPIHPLFRGLGYRNWERSGGETLNFAFTLEDESKRKQRIAHVVGDVMDADGGVLPGYVSMLTGMFGGESLVLSSKELNVLVLLLHRIALRHGIYVWNSKAMKDLNGWEFGPLTNPRSWEGNPKSVEWLEGVWRGDEEAGGGEAWCVGKWRRGKGLMPLAVIVISRSSLTLELQGNVRVSPVDVLRRPIRELCGPEAVKAMTRYSSKMSGNHYMLASQVRQIHVVTSSPGALGNWVGMVAAMMSYVSRKHTRSVGTRSWICTTPTHRTRLAFGIHQVMWFQPILPKGSMFETRKSFPALTLYRPPLLATEALLILNTFLGM
jgi:hypothetical protein